MATRPVTVPGPETAGAAGVTFGGDAPLTVMAGPCQLESEAHALAIAGEMAGICARHGLGYVFIARLSNDIGNATELPGQQAVWTAIGIAAFTATVRSSVAT